LQLHFLQAPALQACSCLQESHQQQRGSSFLQGQLQQKMQKRQHLMRQQQKQLRRKRLRQMWR
jgi:hypothetical protein